MVRAVLDDQDPVRVPPIILAATSSTPLGALPLFLPVAVAVSRLQAENSDNEGTRTTTLITPSHGAIILLKEVRALA